MNRLVCCANGLPIYLSPLFLAVPLFWDQFGIFILVAIGAVVAILLHKGLKKPAAEDPTVKRHASCHCLYAQYEPDEDEPGEEGAGQPGIRRPEWQELLLHTEVQDTNSGAWNSLEAYIAKIRDSENQSVWQREYDLQTA